jgi:hypothetical protein
MARKRSRVVGIEATVFNLRELSNKYVNDAAAKAMEDAGYWAMGIVYLNLTSSDHSLSQLRKMGHPYAKRHGSISIHQPETHVVHEVSGRMAATLQGEVKFRASGNASVQRPYYQLGWWGSHPQHVKWVVEGTKAMIGRDVLWLTVSAPHVRPELLRRFVRVMGAELRTMGGLRFGGGGNP